MAVERTYPGTPRLPSHSPISIFMFLFPFALRSEADDLVLFKDTLAFAQSQAAALAKVSHHDTHSHPSSSRSSGGSTPSTHTSGTATHSHSHTHSHGSVVHIEDELETYASDARTVLSHASHQLGTRVWLHDFKDSAHVDHLRRHPVKYKSLLISFMQHALQVRGR